MVGEIMSEGRLKNDFGENVMNYITIKMEE